MTSYNVPEVSSTIIKRGKKRNGNGRVTSASLDPFLLAVDSPKCKFIRLAIKGMLSITIITSSVGLANSAYIQVGVL